MAISPCRHTGPLTNSRAGDCLVDSKSHRQRVSSGKSGPMILCLSASPSPSSCHHAMSALVSVNGASYLNRQFRDSDRNTTSQVPPCSSGVGALMPRCPRTWPWTSGARRAGDYAIVVDALAPPHRVFVVVQKAPDKVPGKHGSCSPGRAPIPPIH